MDGASLLAQYMSIGERPPTLIVEVQERLINSNTIPFAVVNDKWEFGELERFGFVPEMLSYA